ncbi:MAG TPA: hypothetical protein VND68_06340, partial [Chloroflexia bacterium]|nr:hypothetical protein [Chloroflexia bacterium]
MQLEERASVDEILSYESLCALCGTPTTTTDLTEASWLPATAIEMLQQRHPGWELAHGACPACVQRATLEVLLEHGVGKLDEEALAGVPLSPMVARGVLPTHMRLHVDARYQGRGVTLALVDSGFYPHPEL